MAVMIGMGSGEDVGPPQASAVQSELGLVVPRLGRTEDVPYGRWIRDNEE